MNIKALSNKKTRAALIVIGVVFIVGGGLFWGFGATAREVEETEQVVRPVKTISLSETTFMETRSFPGLVNAARETNLAFRVSGPLVAFDVRIGRHVDAGDVLARIDPRDFEINRTRLEAALGEARASLKAMRTGARGEDIARLEAQISAARARLKNAETDFARWENLLADKAISQSRYDGAKVALDTARANVEVLVQEMNKARSGARREDIEAAEARIRRLAADVKAAEHALEDTKLKAPFSGYVSRRFVENYENIRAGAPVVAFLDVSTVEVHTAVPEDLLIRRASIEKIYCTLDAYPGQRFDAKVKEIGRKTDNANQSYPLVVILDIPEGLIVEPGMAAALQVSLKSPTHQESGFVLPAGAVFADADGRSCVWRVDAENMQVGKRPVTTGQLSGNTIQILSGLDAGDRVVTAGARFLREGQKVRILPKTGKELS